MTIKKTNKYIKYVYKKKNLLSKFPSQPTKDKTLSINGNSNSICFLNQGLKSKDIASLRVLLNRIGVKLEKIPLRLWKKVKWDHSKDTKTLEGTKGHNLKKDIYGDIFILSSTNSLVSSPRQQFKEKSWLAYIYHQNINFKNYQTSLRFQASNKGSVSREFVKYPFDMLGTQRNIDSFSFSINARTTKIEKPRDIQTVYPWDIISAEPSKIKDEDILDLSNLNWESSQDEITNVDFVEHWNDTQGHPVQALMDHVSANHFQFLGEISFYKNKCKINYPNHNGYDWSSYKHPTKKVVLHDWAKDRSSTLIDLPFLRISGVSSVHLC